MAAAHSSDVDGHRRDVPVGVAAAGLRGWRPDERRLAAAVRRFAPRVEVMDLR